MGDLVEARPTAHRPVGAKGVNAAQYQSRIAGAEHLITEAHAFQRARFEVLDDDVGVIDQLLDGGQPFGGAQVNAHAAFVAVTR
ncbi:hypothetical protein D3C74_477750 [compost metagenome]